MDKEIWKDIKGLEGKYQVSNYGNVRSVDRLVQFKDGRVAHYKGKQMKLRKNQDGYLQVQLCPTSATIKTVKVHRLVAEAFIDNPERKKEINHIDENKLNNYADNLEWSDRIHNCNHGTRNQRIAKSRGIPVVVDNIVFPSYKSAAEFLGVTGEAVRESVAFGYLCKGRVIRRAEYA